MCSVVRHSAEPPHRRTSAQEILEHLERANLFIVRLDNRREWYRFHKLFGDLLRYRLQRTHAERLPELHRRAACWYARAGDPDEAMSHALAGSDMVLAADLAEQFLLYMTGTRRVVTYLGWLQQIPDEIVRHRSYLYVGGGWAHVLTNQAEAAKQCARAGEAALPAYQPVVSTAARRRSNADESAAYCDPI